jgi:Type IV secretion system pilin
MKINNKYTRSLVATGATLALTVARAFAGDETVVTITDPDMGVGNFGSLITAGIQMAMLLAALITFIFLIWGGLQWITSGGDKAKYEEARNRITAALVGLAIVAASWAIMLIVEQFFGIEVISGEGFNIPTPASVSGGE